MLWMRHNITLVFRVLIIGIDIESHISRFLLTCLILIFHHYHRFLVVAKWVGIPLQTTDSAPCLPRQAEDWHQTDRLPGSDSKLTTQKYSAFM